MNDPTREQLARPWYREPWPWIIIGLLGTVIIASLITLWIAASNPDGLVVDEAEYREIRRGLRAQESGSAGENEATSEAPDSESGSDQPQGDGGA